MGILCGDVGTTGRVQLRLVTENTAGKGMLIEYNGRHGVDGRVSDQVHSSNYHYYKNDFRPGPFIRLSLLQKLFSGTGPFSVPCETSRLCRCIFRGGYYPAASTIDSIEAASVTNRR
jgi:hypothetical protein